MTQLELARKRKISPEMRRVARDEKKTAEYVREMIAAGRMVIPRNKLRRADIVLGIGAGLRTKVNANLGTSKDFIDVNRELAKLRAVEEAGADTVMDLSTGGDITAIRRRILGATRLPLGSVPIYEAAVRAVHEKKTIMAMTAAGMLRAVENHCKDGVDFVTVHCGVTRAVVKELETSPRLCGIVSRGGTFLAHWILRHRQENPLYERFDELIDIAREFDVTLSLGDSLRPGAIADAMDGPQIEELMTLADLARRAVAAGVQVMIEGPGHVPLDQVEAQIKLEKELTGGLPFYVLGPIVTDVAPGYDHITSAIGGAVAAMAGADFLCYVTATEHLGLPRPQDVREGVVAARIAAHAADVARGRPGAREWDLRMSRARAARDWEKQAAEAIDPERARELRRERRPGHDDVCSMCGDYCVFKVRNGDKERGGV